MFRVMVTDDEALAREELARIIHQTKDFQVTVSVPDGQAALTELKKAPIDVIFLDIEMPGLTGLEVASALLKLEHPPYVVFATAYHKYAIEAFEANAIDYVLKPYDPARIEKALERVRTLAHQPTADRHRQLVSLEDHLIQKGILKKIVAHKKNAKDRIVLDPAEVLYFYVHYSEVLARVESGELIVKATIKELLASLDPGQFSQTHKSYIVNLNRVEKVSPMFSGNFEITIKHGSKLMIPLSRRYAKDLKARLGNW